MIFLALYHPPQTLWGPAGQWLCFPHWSLSISGFSIKDNIYLYLFLWFLFPSLSEFFSPQERDKRIGPNPDMHCPMARRILPQSERWALPLPTWSQESGAEGARVLCLHGGTPPPCSLPCLPSSPPAAQEVNTHHLLALQALTHCIVGK